MQIRRQERGQRGLPSARRPADDYEAGQEASSWRPRRAARIAIGPRARLNV